MLTVSIDEIVNGFVIRAYDSSGTKYALNEFREERLEALKLVERFFRDEIEKELERRINNASTM